VRKIYSPNPELKPITSTVPVTKGGTNATAGVQAVANIGGIHRSMIGAPNGVARVGLDGRLSLANIDANISTGTTIDGPLSVATGSTTLYDITNFDTGTVYSVSTVSGSATLSGTQISYVAPGGAGTSGFIINGKTFDITVTGTTTGSVNNPIITSPTDGVANQPSSVTVSTQAFAVMGGTDTHAETEWTLDNRTNPLVPNVVVSGATDLLSHTFNGLAANTLYAVTVRFRGTNLGWSGLEAITFTTSATFGYRLISTISHSNTGFGSIVDFDSTGHILQISQNQTGTGNYFGIYDDLTTDMTYALQTSNYVVSNKSAMSYDGSVAVGIALGVASIYKKTSDVFSSVFNIIPDSSYTIKNIDLSRNGNKAAIVKQFTSDSRYEIDIYTIPADNSAVTFDYTINTNLGGGYNFNVLLNFDGSRVFVGNSTSGAVRVYYNTGQEYSINTAEAFTINSFFTINSAGTVLYIDTLRKDTGIGTITSRIKRYTVSDGFYYVDDVSSIGLQSYPTVTISGDNNTRLAKAVINEILAVGFIEDSLTGYVYAIDIDTRVQKIVNPNPSAGDKFGYSVAISESGDRLAIGAPGINKVFVYKR
jgi:hypothetical protein